MTKNNYYKKINEYYNKEACTYEERQYNNSTIYKIRKDFRNITLQHLTGEKILDFGCGIGGDICYFAKMFPNKTFTGIDVSDKMLEQAQNKISNAKLNNVHFIKGSIENIHDEKFDLIYVFFGSLNTVQDLDKAVEKLYYALKDGGKIIVTFVNKWYFLGTITQLMKLKFKSAFKRLRNVWGGYSPKYFLESKTYYPSQIKKCFHKFTLITKRGYSITHPAWYQDRITKKLGAFSNSLWRFDTFLSKTSFWAWGEYILLVYQKN